MQVLQNVAHRGTCIQSLNGGSLRILAVCPESEVKGLLEKWSIECPDLEVRVSPWKSWRILSQDLLDLDAQKDRFRDMLVQQTELRKKEFEDTQHRAKNRLAAPEVAPEVPTIANEVSEHEVVAMDIDSEAYDSAPTKLKGVPLGVPVPAGVPSVPMSLTRESQKFVGLAILPDIAKPMKALKDHEPAFQVLCVGTTEEEVASKLQAQSNELVDPTSEVPTLFSQVPLACVSMQEFVRPAWVSQVSTKRVPRDSRIAEVREALNVTEAM